MAPLQTEEAQASYQAALERERAGYEAKGKPERVAQVDAELERVRGRGAGAERRPRGPQRETR